ncbi:MAG: tRNA-dihydrouridine synthase [Verrucomicrobiota bacterium]
MPLGEHLAQVRARGKVAGLMIGRAALGYPWIFREVKAYLETGMIPPPPALEERWEVLLRYCRTLMERPAHADRWNRLNWMRSRLKAFTKHIPGVRQLRQDLDRVTTYEELEALAAAHRARYAEDPAGYVPPRS